VSDARLLDTQRAFDGVAGDYDSPAGNNEIVQYFRNRLQQTVLALVPTGGRLLDLGCGTGLDVAFFAERGYHVVGVDYSPRMIERSIQRIESACLGHRATARALDMEQLGDLAPREFDAIYSDLGALNCVSDLAGLARACAGCLKPGAPLIASVIGRYCPWEIAYYAVRGNSKRAITRLRRDFVPVRLADGRVWTRYYSPMEFYAHFSDEFELKTYRSLGLVVPPPYLVGIYRRLGRARSTVNWLDDRLGAWAGLRAAGDHFSMVLSRRIRLSDPS
jgi:SAM-dependent methyltransferase